MRGTTHLRGQAVKFQILRAENRTPTRFSCVGSLHRLPEFAENRDAETQNRAKEFSDYEGNRNRAPDRRPWPRGHPQGDPPHHAHPRGRPVTDNIGTVGAVLRSDG